jgi:hypothetical protein
MLKRAKKSGGKTHTQNKMHARQAYEAKALQGKWGGGILWNFYLIHDMFYIKGCTSLVDLWNAE